MYYITYEQVFKYTSLAKKHRNYTSGIYNTLNTFLNIVFEYILLYMIF